MKKFVIFFLVILLFVVGAVVFLPSLVPLDKIKPEIQAKVKEYTGRDIDITGDIKVTLWPDLAVSMKGITISNASWGKAKNFVSIEEVDAKLKLKPLLEKRIEIDKFILKRPQISLEVSRLGKANWEFESVKAKTDSTTNNNIETIKQNTHIKTANKDFNVKFGRLEIIDGSVNYYDAKNSSNYATDKINIAVSVDSINSPISIKGNLQYRARIIDVDLKFSKLSALIDKKPVSGEINLVVKPFLKLYMQGKFFANNNRYISGELKTDIEDMAGFANWISPTVTAVVPFSATSLKIARLEVSNNIEKGLVFSAGDIKFRLDDIDMSGNLKFLQKKSAKPYIEASLALQNMLDIPALITKLSKASKVEANDNKEESKDGGNVSKSDADTVWSDEKIDLSILHSLNGKFAFKYNGLIYKELQAQSGKAEVTLNGGKLLFNMPAVGVNSGLMQAKFLLNENKEKTAINFSILADKMPIKPILKSFADINVLSGSGKVEITARSSGWTQKSIIENLSGKGVIALKDGMVEGIDLVNIAQLLQKKLAKFNLGDKGTKFANLNASFTVNNGILNNKDMRLVGPLIDASGAGNIDLARRLIDYRVKPMLVVKKQSVSAGSGAMTSTKKIGIVVPVDIKGNWDNIQIKPDYASVINNALQDPSKIKETGKAIEKDVREKLKGLKDIKNIKKKVKENPVEILNDIEGAKDLLNGLF